MQRTHSIALSVMLGASAMLGIYTMTSAGGGPDTSAKASATVPVAATGTQASEQAIAARTAALDRAEARMAAALKARPPKLPAQVARHHVEAPAPVGALPPTNSVPTLGNGAGGSQGGQGFDDDDAHEQEVEGEHQEDEHGGGEDNHGEDD